MKHVIDTSEVLGTVDTPGGECEVCASALAQYDEDAGRLRVQLDAFLRTTDFRKKEKRISADWLPRPETIVEGAGPGETIELTKEIFHRWVARVREASPAAKYA